MVRKKNEMNENQQFATLSACKRIVVKVGSGVLTKKNSLNLDVINSIANQICALHDKGLEVILVSSGAMAAGVTKIGLDRRPSETPKRQAVSAIGQADLIREWEKALEYCGRKVAQILLTRGIYATGSGISMPGTPSTPSWNGRCFPLSMKMIPWP